MKRCLCTLALLVFASCSRAGSPYRLQSFDPRVATVVLRFQPPRDETRVWPRPRFPCAVEIRAPGDSPLSLDHEQTAGAISVELNPGTYTLVVSQCRVASCRAVWNFASIELRADAGHNYRLAVIAENATLEGTSLDIGLYDDTTRQVLCTVRKSECGSDTRAM